MRFVIQPIRVLALIALLFPNFAGATPCTGQWDSNLGKLSLKELPNGQVTGKSVQLGSLTGRRNGASVVGTWSQAGRSGRFQLTLSPAVWNFAGKQFDGPNAKGPSQTWTGRRIGKPKPVHSDVAPSFSGNWVMSWGSNRLAMNLRQDGPRLLGSDSNRTTRIDGEIDGNEFRGSWRIESGPSGQMIGTLTNRGRTIKGRWSLGKGPWKKGPWTGSKIELRSSK